MSLAAGQRRRRAHAADLDRRARHQRSGLTAARFGPPFGRSKQDVVGDVGPVLWVLMGTIGIVLVIACANVANLLLVRAEGRQQELTIRAALGAGWGHIAHHLLAESVTLGVVGGALGLALAYAGLQLLWRSGRESASTVRDLIDARVLAFTLAVSVASALLFGLVPAVKVATPTRGLLSAYLGRPDRR